MVNKNCNEHYFIVSYILVNLDAFVTVTHC